ncbi:MAG: RNA polymerase sigma factor FliA [Gammaproteobacteria bacterium]|nr:MAG: RNA polymerase sigma factor FliA [Gammaproteobacteria bacterium]
MSSASAYALAGQLRPEELVERYAPLVKKIGNHLLGRLPDGVELEDLIQTGLIALLDAARQYCPTKGASFETYASIRVRGAMLDEFRNTDWAPRSVYRKQRQLTAAVRAVENRTGTHARAREIAAELGVPLDEYFQMVAATTTQRMFSLDEADPDATAREETADEAAVEPSMELESEEFRAAMSEAIGALPEREALVMSLYYDEELNLKEIGEALGVSESRVCQIHGQALTRLRARLQNWTAAHHDQGAAGR